MSNVNVTLVKGDPPRKLDTPYGDFWVRDAGGFPSYDPKRLPLPREDFNGGKWTANPRTFTLRGAAGEHVVNLSVVPFLEPPAIEEPMTEVSDEQMESAKRMLELCKRQAGAGMGIVAEFEPPAGEESNSAYLCWDGKHGRFLIVKNWYRESFWFNFRNGKLNYRKQLYSGDETLSGGDNAALHRAMCRCCELRCAEPEIHFYSFGQNSGNFKRWRGSEDHELYLELRENWKRNGIRPTRADVETHNGPETPAEAPANGTPEDD